MSPQTIICTIQSIIDIPKMDKIKICKLEENAYEFIINIDDGFFIGEKVIMILNDSLIPDNDRTNKLKCYSFLREKYFNHELNRIRTRIVKIRGIRSVGLLEKITVVDQDIIKKMKLNLEVGSSLDEYFGITKYEPDEFEATPTKQKDLTFFGKIKRWMFIHFPKISSIIFRTSKFKVLKTSNPFPTDRIAKSDEENAQNLVDIIELKKDEPVDATIKYEGSSMTVLRDRKTKELLVCSRNLCFKVTDKLRDDPRIGVYIKTAEKYKLAQVLDIYFQKYGRELIFQGELIGPNIQRNIYKLNEHKFKIYRIVDEGLRRKLSMKEIRDIANEYNLEMVDVVAHYDHLSDFLTPDNIESQVVWMENHSCFEPDNGIDGIKIHFGDNCPKPDPKKGKYFYNEGLVLHFPNDGYSFKLKSKAYKEWFG